MWAVWNKGEGSGSAVVGSESLLFLVAPVFWSRERYVYAFLMLTWDRLGIGVDDQENISRGWLVFAFGKCSDRSCWRQAQLESRQWPFPIPQTNAPPHLEASRSLGRGRCHGHPAKFAWNDTGQWLRSHKGKTVSRRWGLAVQRPAEGLGGNQATIQVAPFSEEKSDCDLLGWNQRNLFFIILLAVYLALSALLSIHNRIPNTQGSSICVITKVPGPRGKMTSKFLFCLAHSQFWSPKSLTTGHPKHSVHQLAQVLLSYNIFSVSVMVNKWILRKCIGNHHRMCALFVRWRHYIFSMDFWWILYSPRALWLCLCVRAPIKKTHRQGQLRGCVTYEAT